LLLFAILAYTDWKKLDESETTLVKVLRAKRSFFIPRIPSIQVLPAESEISSLPNATVFIRNIGLVSQVPQKAIKPGKPDRRKTFYPPPFLAFKDQNPAQERDFGLNHISLARCPQRAHEYKHSYVLALYHKKKRKKKNVQEILPPK
jgi:hypothetical protein